MTLDRPADLSDWEWSRLLARNTITAELSQESSGWSLLVWASIHPGKVAAIAQIDFAQAKKPAESTIERTFASFGISRLDDWAVEEDDGAQAWFVCHLTLPPSQVAEGQAFTDAEEHARAQAQAVDQHQQRVANFGTWRGWTIFLALAGGFLNLLALAPFSVADYRLFRFGICAAAVVLIFLVGAHKSWVWLVALLPAAILWNPIFPFYFARPTWAPLNIVAVVCFAALGYWALHLKAPPAPVADQIAEAPARGNNGDQP